VKRKGRRAGENVHAEELYQLEDLFRTCLSTDGNNRKLREVLEPEDLRRTGRVHGKTEAESQPVAGTKAHAPGSPAHDLLGITDGRPEAWVGRWNPRCSRGRGKQVEVPHPLLAEEVDHELVHVQAHFRNHLPDLGLSGDRNGLGEIVQASDILGPDAGIVETLSVKRCVFILPLKRPAELFPLQLPHSGCVQPGLDIHVPVGSFAPIHGLPPMNFPIVRTWARISGYFLKT